MEYKKLTPIAPGEILEIDNETEMTSRLNSTNVGQCYKYVGTTGTYVNGDLYIVEKEFPGLKFTANTAGSTISMSIVGTPAGSNFSYSTNGSTWTTFTPGTTTITLTNAGDKVYFKGNNPSGINRGSDSNYCQFVMTGSIAASGNIMSLIDNGACSTLAVTFGCFLWFFKYCTALTTPPALPATTLSDMCYDGMFMGCTGLVSAPALPATTLTSMCYDKMFVDCTALTTPPALPATTLADECYFAMFAGCTSLQVNDSPISGTAEQEWRIPIDGVFINSADADYDEMFGGCVGTRSYPSWTAGSSKTYYTQNTPV